MLMWWLVAGALPACEQPPSLSMLTMVQFRGQAHRNDNEGPPRCMTIQLAWRTAVKSHFTNDEEVIANPVPQTLVA